MKRFFSRAQGKPVPEQVANKTLVSEASPGGLSRAFTSLRQRNFRLFWSGQIFSQMGYIMQNIGQGWLVLEMTDSPWQLGLVGALQAFPILLFSIFAGVMADRWPKRTILLVTQSLSMVQAFLLWILIASGTMQLWHLYVLAFLLGILNSLGRPASRSFTVELVGRKDLSNAIALSSSLTTLAFVMGPGLGGIIIAISGVTTLFLLNALSFIGVIIGLLLINSHELHAQAQRPVNADERQSTWQSLREGFIYIRQTPAVLLMILVVGLVLLFGSNYDVILPLFTTEVFKADATAYGFLSASIGIGALLATLWLIWHNPKPAVRPALFCMMAFALLQIAFAFSPFYPLSLVIIASVGFMESTFAARAMTILQTVIPDNLRGRVMSVQVLFFDGSLPLGYLLMGGLSDHSGPIAALIICALLTLMVAGAGWIWKQAAEKDIVTFMNTYKEG